MSLSPSGPRLNPQRGAPYRRQRLADVLDAIVPAIESLGFEVYGIIGDGFAIRHESGRVHGVFRLSGDFVSAAADPDPGDSDRTDDDGFIEPEDDRTMPSRRGSETTRTADTTLTPEEELWKEQLKPFSRNQIADVDTHRSIARAIESYDQHRRML